MSHQDLNYWKNKDGNYFHAVYSNGIHDISCACNRAIAAGDFEIMVFHADGDPVDAMGDDSSVRCCVEELGTELDRLMLLYDDPGVDWFRKK